MRQPYSSRILFMAVLLSCLLLWVQCSRVADFNHPVSTDKTKPGVVTNIKVKNFNGGAYITYTLPKSENILYVKANYVINEKNQKALETKSAYYSDTVTVEGFSESKEYEVTLRVVSRSNVESDPVTVKVHPDTPIYQLVGNTLSLGADFAGIRVDATNEARKNVGVVLVYKDPYYGRYVIRQQQFSNFKDIFFTSRGLDTLPKQVGVYATDKWGNISDTVFKTIKPLYETLLNKSKFSVYNLASDSPIGYGWVTANLWDNNPGSGWHTPIPPGNIPVTVSFNLGTSAKLSRFLLWGRADVYYWGHGNPKYFTVWGSNSEQPADFTPPANSEEGQKIGEWINIGNYRFPDPPSGNAPSSPTAADKAWFNAGVEFIMPFNAPKVRFLRVVVTENWAGTNVFAHIMELSFYGDTRP
ncbi:DUF4959 domain-containing protein [Niabella drilacis]|uniref:F5/8 type C domain-containing protein n=1 Tax=Niabella drilacis (strain DSM 25811 / CCM 8410 / CCUG 62505 / LMG 26954 / E90) TaxID=1285928 RepID=A0A1G6RKA3_NIADE|nr:DUF4959 domain-containing protein [Niabella drilacis]SDD04425.1 protein of unknown function [Niabella drilacis]